MEKIDYTIFIFNNSKCFSIEFLSIKNRLENNKSTYWVYLKRNSNPFETYLSLRALDEIHLSFLLNMSRFKLINPIMRCFSFICMRQFIRVYFIWDQKRMQFILLETALDSIRGTLFWFHICDCILLCLRFSGFEFEIE